ncbi:hypothetical protein PspLS_11848 [Pyricularia sp. CBS 133598]|nr:hypothetical protein PspLS_11848 [Pyricularia sp. CBS 133598]
MQGTYHKIPAAPPDDDSENGNTYRSPRTLSRYLKFSPAFTFIIFLGALTIAASLLRVRDGDRKNPAVTECGSTPNEARARGCRFETHNFAWTPPECYDEELNKIWDSKPWGYARDSEGTQLIPREEVQKGDLKWAYVTLGQHLSHCVLIWQKYQRAVMFDRPVDNWTVSFPHTYHCGHLLVQWDLNHTDFNSILYTKYVSCGYDWKRADERMEGVMSGSMDGGLVGDGGNHGDTSSGHVLPGHEDEHHQQ